MIKKQLTMFIALLALSSAFLTSEARLLVAPNYILLDETTRSAKVTIANSGDDTKIYRVTLVNQNQLEDGSYERTDTPAAGEFFANKVIRFGPRQVTLDPGQSQSVRIQRRFKSGDPDGEYRSHLFFQEVPEEKTATKQDPNQDGLSFSIVPIYGVTIPVIARKGSLDTSVTLENVKIVQLDRSENRLKQDKYAVKLKIKRAGTASVRGNLTVFAEGEQIAVLNGVNVFLSTDHRNVTIPLETSPQVLRGKSVTIEYRETPELGGNLITMTPIKL